MADNGTAQSASTQALQLPSFQFKVSISNVGDISCSEVSGLETEYEEIIYRAGDSPVFTKLKMPGLRKAGDLTLKKGITGNDKALRDWVNKVKQNNIQRETVSISLLDESGNPVKTWEAVNAWPKKLTVEDFCSDGHTTSIEVLIIALLPTVLYNKKESDRKVYDSQSLSFAFRLSFVFKSQRCGRKMNLIVNHFALNILQLQIL